MSRFFLILATLAVLLAGPVLAQQGVQISFGQSLRLDGSSLEVTADQLNVDQTSGATVFSGNVVAAQGGMRIASETLRLEYQPNSEGGSQRIERLIASGGVTMTTPEEALEGREAVYQLETQMLEMTGSVMLVQGQNMLSGERFVADLRTGNGQMIGRVRTVIRME